MSYTRSYRTETDRKFSGRAFELGLGSLRDGVADALARHIWQDRLPGGAAANTYVFCGVFLRRLFNEGPAAVAAMTKRRDLFAASRLIFFVCHQYHWLLVVIDGVADLHVCLWSMTRCGRVPRASPAKLATLYSAPGAGSVDGVVSVVQKCVAAAAISKDLGASMRERVARRWEKASLKQESPSVPRHSPGTNYCGDFVVSFFACLSASDDNRCRMLLSSGSVARNAWETVWKVYTLSDLVDICVSIGLAPARARSLMVHEAVRPRSFARLRHLPRRSSAVRASSSPVRDVEISGASQERFCTRNLQEPSVGEISSDETRTGGEALDSSTESILLGSCSIGDSRKAASDPALPLRDSCMPAVDPALPHGDSSMAAAYPALP